MKQIHIFAIMTLFALGKGESQCAANGGSACAPAMVQTNIERRTHDKAVKAQSSLTSDSELGENSSSGSGDSCGTHSTLASCTQNGCAWVGGSTKCARACSTRSDCNGNDFCDGNVCKYMYCGRWNGPNNQRGCSHRQNEGLCFWTGFPLNVCSAKPACGGVSADGSTCGPQSGRCRNPGSFCNEATGLCGTGYEFESKWNVQNPTWLYDYDPWGCTVFETTTTSPTYTLLGKGECMDEEGNRVDHCYDGSKFVKSKEQCQSICDAIATCKAYEYGRGDQYYNCAVYPESGDNTGVDSRMTCNMHKSKSPVMKARDFGHDGHCYKK
eukprot:TRINITY_DN78873_c0_g1_i1.p1 TRINITY_DN78873_c0_g1~~TRINITY_DN78873_c0_g1_i1.p1  ORF type:complete len:326 (-),score=17.40 TRINITY_DN78873_c0_g1_i1:11-988(-)